MRVRPRSRLQMHSGNDLHRWTVSYADYMTLMFAVFVVLYAVAANNKEQYKDVVLSIQTASKLLNQSVFNSHLEGILTKNSNSIIEDSGPAMLSEGMINQANDELSDVDTLKAGWELSELKLQLEQLFLSEVDGQQVKIKQDANWLTIELGGSLLFPAASHSLLTSSNTLINNIAKILSPADNMIRIRGYTDQQAISNEIYKSNWELSGMRAFSVLHALIKQGVAAPRMVVEAYGEFYPILDGSGIIGVQQSRRVVIAVSKYGLLNNKNAHKQTTKTGQPVTLGSKPDSEDIQEILTPDNRLIITTRQD